MKNALLVLSIVFMEAIAFAGNVQKIEKTGNTGPMGQPYHKIICSDGSTHRYYRHDGEWYSPYGVAGHSSKSIKQLAEYKCR